MDPLKNEFSTAKVTILVKPSGLINGIYYYNKTVFKDKNLYLADKKKWYNNCPS